MKNKSKSPATSFRLDEGAKQELKFIQDHLSAPGLPVNQSEAVRRALYGFANQLRSQKKDRRSDGQDGTSKSA